MTHTTETASARYRGLDAWEPEEILRSLWEAQTEAAAAVQAALASIETAVLASGPCLNAGGRLAYAGAGTSGRIAAQDAAELTPTFGWSADRTVLLLAGGIASLAKSVEDAEDDAAGAEHEVASAGIGAGDVLVGLAASGRTPFTLACVNAARERGATTIGVANVAHSPLLEMSEYPILVETGPEPIAGSTRLKAGTAQKIVLNLFSTLLMTRLGHVHDGLMIDMQPRNAKLRRRAQDMLIAIAGCTPDVAEAALAQSGGNVKRAVLLVSGLDAGEAERALGRHGGRLRAVLAELGR